MRRCPNLNGGGAPSDQTDQRPWILVLLVVILCSLVKATTIWNMADVAVGIMALLNIIAIPLLSGVAAQVVRGYDIHRRQQADIKSAQPDVWGLEETPA